MHVIAGTLASTEGRGAAKPSSKDAKAAVPNQAGSSSNPAVASDGGTYAEPVATIACQSVA